MTDTFTRIPARTAEIGGGVPVARMLPSRHRRTIGAWCFLDHAGPARFAAGQGLRVGPHPHTGLQTFTWMLEGEVLHRDSLGNEQVIRAGQVNLMTAGRGIAHTEESVAGETRLHTAQLWIALPARVADMAPRFDHYPDLPRWNEGGAEAVLLAGAFMGRQSPVLVHTPLVGVDWHAPRDAALTLALDPAFEYGLVPLTGPASAQGQALAADELLYLPPGADTLRLELPAGTRAEAVMPMRGRAMPRPLAGQPVAGMIEAIIGVAEAVGPKRVRPGPRDAAMRTARVCYDHLAGEQAVAMLDRLVERKMLLRDDDGIRLAPAGAGHFAALGIEIDGSARRPVCRACLDWSVRRSHLAGALGAAILDKILAEKWARREKASRAVVFSPPGRQAFEKVFLA